MNTHESAARLADVQARGVENAFALARAATSVFERIARQNYAVMGDVVDYSLDQIRIPTRHTDPRAVLEAQAAGTRGFAEKARARADEYATIAGEVRELVGGAVGRAAADARGGAKTAADAASSVPASNAAVPAGASPAEAAAKTASAAAKVKRQAAKAADGSADASKRDAGGTPIILPDDSPKAAGRKSAAAATTPKSAAKKRTAASAASPKTAPKTAPKSKTRAVARRSAAKTTSRRGAKG